MSGIRNTSEGFTLVELLVSIAVGAIVITSLNMLVSGYLHVSQRGRYLNATNSFVEGKVEALRNSGYNAVTVGSSSITSQLPSLLPPSRSASMTVSTPSNGIKQVDITVSYKDEGLTRTYSYTTYIGELGVGQ